MTRGTVVIGVFAAAALGIAALLLLLASGEVAPVVPPPTPAPTPPPKPPRPRGRARWPAEPPAARAPAAPLPVLEEEAARPLTAEEEEEAQVEMMEYPEGARGPVVVGRVVLPGDHDPKCWIALESVEDRGRPDPSVVESLAGGRFRLTGFAPGRYRVRAKDDDAPAVYSREITAVDGAVVDSGVLRLHRPACIAGTVRDAGGREVPAKVRLLGRDPSSLVPGVVAVVDSIPVQGFQIEPHETGPYEIAVEAEEGWAVHRGSTDDAGFGGVEVRLQPWGAVRAGIEPEESGDASPRVERIEVEAKDAPAVGRAARPQTLEGPGTVDRLPAGEYGVRFSWAADPDSPGPVRVLYVRTRVEAGKTAEVVAPR